MIQVLQRAMDILSTVSKEKDGYTVIQLAEKLSLNRGTCSTIVQSLAEEGYLIKLKKTRNYILGPRVFGLTRRRYFMHDVVMPAKPSIDTLSRKTGYPCVLAVIFQDRYYLIYTTGQETGIPRDDELVYLEDVSHKATGRMLLSMLPETGLDLFLKKNPATTDNWPDAGSVMDTLTGIRGQGYALSADRGFAGLAVSVGTTGDCTVALGLYLAQEKCTSEKTDSLIPQLKDAAAVILREYSRSL